MASHPSFKASDLEVEVLPTSQLAPKPDTTNLPFGSTFTDYMFEVAWDKATGWSKPKIVPVHNLSIHPGAKTLHYAMELFEATKAFRGVDGKLRLFRPDLHVTRFLNGAKRMRMPEFDGNEFLECLKRLLTLEQDWMGANTSSVYVRPVLIGTEPSLWTTPSQKALLYIILCPLAPFNSPAFEKPISLLADPQYVRCWPGGSGDTKFGANYGPTVAVQEAAERAGHFHVLWLIGEDHQLTEIGIMNVFIFLENQNGEKELVTPPLNGVILPGVNRRSCLELAREWNQFKVSERSITMKELTQAVNENRVLEIFGSATMRTICPVGNIHYMGVDYKIPTCEQRDPLYKKFFNILTDMCYGKVSHPWSVQI